MKVVFKKSVADSLCDAMEAANKAGKSIDHIKLSEDEFRELRAAAEPDAYSFDLQKNEATYRGIRVEVEVQP